MIVGPLLGVLVVLALAWLILRWRLGERVSPKLLLLLGLPVLILLALGDVLDMNGLLFRSPGQAEKVDLSAELFTVDGRQVSIEDFEGKVLFLNFWATWCGPCRMEMPSMAGLYRQLKEEGLVMVAVTDEDPETVRTFLERDSYPFPVLIDTARTLSIRFRVTALPTTLVIDDERRVVMEHTGGYQWDTPEVIERFRGFLSADREALAVEALNRQ